MEKYYNKAKELGDMILASEEAIYLADARAAFEADENSVEKLKGYTSYQHDVQVAMESGVLSQEDFQKMTKRLNEMGQELKNEPLIGELIKAETEFNFFVNQVMNILKQTIMRTDGSEGCSGNCDGCSSCSN